MATIPAREARAKSIDELREIGRRAKAFMDSLPPDSPLRSTAFKLCALTGKIEAAVVSAQEKAKP